MHASSTRGRRPAGRLALALLFFAPAWPALAQPAVSADTAAEAASRIELWPGGLAPGDAPLAMPQRILERSADPALPDRYIEGVARPYLVVYRPARPNGTALLVAPGGGYQRIVLDKEGSALVPAFAEAGGITLFVLRYRLPGEGHPQGRDVPLADAQRAIRLIRARAAAFGIDPHRVGVMGFSAGGHVAASLGTRFDERSYPVQDAADRLSARPDFQLLVYPVIDMGQASRCAAAAGECEASAPIAHPGSRRHLLGDAPDAGTVRRYSLQNRVDARTPPTFLVHAQDDAVVPVENSLLFYDALRRAGVPAEMHLFPRGGHGFGTRGTAGLTTAAWPRLALAWIDSLQEETAK
ncbi:alpha/beta hydrolase [[Pseudomonas] boreopolis]|uniref:alpha/beta hydrolase n=1 Tax=Xanthomonas boreopolis TaxID=86183 RepID=UPI003D40925E